MRLGREVVVTGLGWETPLGGDKEQTWQRVLNGDIGISTYTQPEGQIAPPVTIGGLCDHFDHIEFAGRKEGKRMSRFIHLGSSAADKALLDAGLSKDNLHYDPKRIGAAISTGIGGFTTQIQTAHDYYQEGFKKVPPFMIPGSLANMVSGSLCIRYGIRGPSVAIVSACATATQCIGHAARLVANGYADAMFCGGSEAAHDSFSLAAFARMQALSQRNDDPESASRPWDKDRDGFVMAEGCGILLLETLESAQARNAPIYAHISGYAETTDAYHVAAPKPDGEMVEECMKLSIEDAGLSTNDIDYVNAHATSTPLGDAIEINALKRLMGDHAPVTNSTKAQFGHLLGAAGAVEAVVGLLSIRDQKVHPAVNIFNVDPECEYNFPKKAQDVKINHMISNSFGFGGVNASLVFSKT